MFPITIKFQAYIPKSLGKPLLSYFKQDTRFRLLDNKEDFIRKLKAMDAGGHTWIPEPYSTNLYCATDNVNFHQQHGTHSFRLGCHLEIDPKKIGNFHFGSEVFKHKDHLKGKGLLGHQHSGKSRRVQAYIKRIPFYTDMPRASTKDYYIGVCMDVFKARSDEKPLDYSISNSRTDFPSNGNYDTTTIKVSASAGYPFLPSPNIDFTLKIEVYKNLGGRSIDVHVSGWHNDFPAYELLVEQGVPSVPYHYKPKSHGPTFSNLTHSKHFSILKRIY